MNIKINDYIIRGGENLNDPPRKTPSFPNDAKELFDNWHSKLGKNDAEKVNYFELPVNDKYRLFIRSIYMERPGSRPICYYIGMIVYKETYNEAKYYSCLHKGLCTVSLSNIQDAEEASFAPLEVELEGINQKIEESIDFQKLSKIERYGENEFNSNLDEVLWAIPNNNIEEWFEKLFIAVNPYQMDPSFNIIISREKPRQKGQQRQDFSRNMSSSRTFEKPHENFYNLKNKVVSILPKEKNRKYLKMLPFILLILFLLYLYNHLGGVSQSPYYEIDNEYIISKENYNKLEEDYKNLCRKIDVLEKENIKLKEENRELKEKNGELKENRELKKKNGELVRENRELKEKNGELKENRELKKKNGELVRENRELKEKNGELKEKNEELEKSKQKFDEQ